MEKLPPAVSDYLDQWATLLSSRICYASQLDKSACHERIEQLASKCSDPKDSELLRAGFSLTSQYQSKEIEQMYQVVSDTVFQFHQDPFLPSMFSSIFHTTHSFLITPFLSQSPKTKALHTEELVHVEMLTPLQRLTCDVFKWLSDILLAAIAIPSVPFSNIDISVVRILFDFLAADASPPVRSSIGQIMAALSKSDRHCEEILKLFWSQFSQCKKDDDFRNFASLIYGIEQLQLSISNRRQITLSFFSSFLSYSKKFERGVIRMKFLDALLSIYKSTFTESPKDDQEFHSQINEVWTLVVKWSSKSKHTAFCYAFLQKFLSIAPPYIFLDGKGKQLLEILCKAGKSGEIQILNLVVDWVRTLPKEFWVSRVDEFVKCTNNDIFQMIFTGSQSKRALRFSSDEQIGAITQILGEVGKKQILLVIDFARSTLSIEKPSDDLKKVRQVALQTLSTLAHSVPDQVAQYNTELFPLIEPVLLQSVVFSQNEVALALPSFPLIHSQNDTKQAQVSQVLFEYSMGNISGISSSAFLALKDFIENLVTLTSNTLLPITYMSNLMKSLPLQSQIPKKASMIAGIADSFSKMLQKGDLKIIKEGGSTLTPPQWNDFRHNLDSNAIILLLSPEEEVHEAAISLEKAFTAESIETLDALCGSDTWISKWLFSVNYKKDFLSISSEFADKSPEISKALFKSTFEFWKANRNSPVSQRIICFLSSIAIGGNDEFFEELFSILKENSTDVEVVHSLIFLRSSQWCQLLTDLERWMAASGQNGWGQYCEFYYAFSLLSDFPNVLKEQKFCELYERMLTKFWKGQQQSSQTTTERCLQILNLFVEVSASKTKNIIEEGSNEQFLQNLIAMANVKNSAQFSPTFPETFIDCLNSVFKCGKFFTPKTFIPFSTWLITFYRITSKSESLQSKICQMLTTILNQNSTVLVLFLKSSLCDFPPCGKEFILAMANVFESRSDFLTSYPNPASIIAATLLVHIKNPDFSCRQAALRILLLMEKNNMVSNLSNSLKSVISPNNLVGAESKANEIIKFLSEQFTAENCISMIAVVSEVLSLLITSKSPIVLTISEFIRKPLSQSKQTLAVTAQVLKITSKCDFTDPSVELSLRKLWQEFCNGIDKSMVVEVLKSAFEFGLDSDSDALTSIQSYCYLYKEFPKEVIEFLCEFISIYKERVPESIKEFTDFLAKPPIEFTLSKERILSANIITSIIPLSSGLKVFGSNLPTMLFFAISIYGKPESVICGEIPLLEAIAAKFTNKSISPKSESFNDEASQELTTIDSTFRDRFTDLIYSSAFQGKTEAFGMLNGKEVTPNSVFQLLLFAVHTLKSGNSERILPVVNLVHNYLKSAKECENETSSSIIVFVLLLALKLDQVIANSLMKTITEIIEQAMSLPSAATVKTQVANFFGKVGADKFVASLFTRYIEDLQTFADCEPLILALLSLSKIFEPSNWCLLVSSLVDSIRYFLTSRNKNPLGPLVTVFDHSSIDAYASELLKTFKEQQKLDFVVEFMGDMNKKAASRDLQLDVVSLQIIEAFVRVGDLKFSQDLSERLMNLARMLTLSSEEPGKTCAIKTFVHISTHLEAGCHSSSINIAVIKPSFIVITRKPIATALPHQRLIVNPFHLPDFDLFVDFSKTNESLVDSLWEYIGSQIKECGGRKEFVEEKAAEKAEGAKESEEIEDEELEDGWIKDEEAHYDGDRQFDAEVLGISSQKKI